jgi:hypothetical protein
VPTPPPGCNPPSPRIALSELDHGSSQCIGVGRLHKRHTWRKTVVPKLIKFVAFARSETAVAEQ